MRRNKGDGIVEVWASGRTRGTWATWPEDEGNTCSCSVDDPAARSELAIVDCKGCKACTDRTDAFGEDNDDDDASVWEGGKGDCIDPLFTSDKACS